MLQRADDLPVIDVSRDRSHPRWLPVELCEIPPNQAYHGLLSGKAMVAMRRIASNPPAYNAESIVNQGFPQLGLDSRSGPLQGFGISISDQMTTIPARVLSPPGVAYKSGRPNVREASWSIGNMQFQRGGNMSNWAVLLVNQGVPIEFSGVNDPQLTSFLQTFAKKCRDSGMTVPNGPPNILSTHILPPTEADPRRAQGMKIIEKTLKDNIQPRNKPSFILVLLSKVDDYIYPGIKRLCDVDIGLTTVTMLLDKARKDGREQDLYFSNVTLKVNIKLGGINHTLDPDSMAWLKRVPTMLVGIGKSPEVYTKCQSSLDTLCCRCNPP